jgi:hypothetical protein
VYTTIGCDPSFRRTCLSVGIWVKPDPAATFMGVHVEPVT